MDAETDDERKIPGGPPGNDTHENGFVEFSVLCGKCGLRMCRVTAEVYRGVSNNGPDFHDPGIGKDREEGNAVQRAVRHLPGHGRSMECLEGDGVHSQLWPRSFMFVCGGKRCDFRQQVNRVTLLRAMKAAWQRGSYEIRASHDF